MDFHIAQTIRDSAPSSTYYLGRIVLLSKLNVAIAPEIRASHLSSHLQTAHRRRLAPFVRTWMPGDREALSCRPSTVGSYYCQQ